MMIHYMDGESNINSLFVVNSFLIISYTTFSTWISVITTGEAIGDPIWDELMNYFNLNQTQMNTLVGKYSVLNELYLAAQSKH